MTRQFVEWIKENPGMVLGIALCIDLVLWLDYYLDTHPHPYGINPVWFPYGELVWGILTFTAAFYLVYGAIVVVTVVRFILGEIR